MPIGTPVLVASGSNAAGATSLNAAALDNIAAGQTLLALYGLRDDETPSAPSVTDDAITPTAYTADDDDNSAAVVSFITHASLHRLTNNSALDGPTPGPAQNVTASITSSGIASSCLAVAQVDGLDLSDPLDGDSAVASANSAAPDSGSITPSAGQRLLVGWVAFQGRFNIVVDDANFAELAELTADTGVNGSSTQLQLVYRIVTADGLTAYNFAPGLGGSSRTWVCGIRAYKAAAAAPAAAKPAAALAGL